MTSKKGWIGVGQDRLPWGLSGKESTPMQETQVQSLSRKDPLEEEKDNPRQYSHLGNPVDRGASLVTVHGAVKELDTS